MMSVSQDNQQTFGTPAADHDSSAGRRGAAVNPPADKLTPRRYTAEELQALREEDHFRLQAALTYRPGLWPDDAQAVIGTRNSYSACLLSDLDRQWALARAAGKARKGLYRAFAPMRGLPDKGKAGGARDHIALPGLVFDLDCQHGVHKPSGVPDATREQAERVLMIFREHGVKITYVIDSGGGLQAAVITTEPLRIRRRVKEPHHRLPDLAKRALVAVSTSLGVSPDTHTITDSATKFRAAAGVNGKTKPGRPDGTWTAERLALIPDDIRDRPVRLIEVTGETMTPDELRRALSSILSEYKDHPRAEAGKSAPREPARDEYHRHSCGGTGDWRDQVCTSEGLPMSRLLRELSRFDGLGEMDDPAGPGDIPDPGAKIRLHWDDDPDPEHTTAELAWDKTDTSPAASVIPYGSWTSDMLGCEQSRPTCAFWYVRNVHCGGDTRLAYALLEHFDGDADGLFAALDAQGDDPSADQLTTDIPALTGRAEAAPEPALSVPRTMADVEAVCRKWWGGEYDLDAIRFAAAIRAAHELEGDPVWGLLITGSGNTKTETMCALARTPRAWVESDITSAGALLSGTSKRERAKDCDGGLLRKIGDNGVLILKDVTTILSKNKNVRDEVLAALREVYDGHYSRTVGTDGGKTLTWQGRVTFLGAVTTAWDEHHAVIQAFGDRFVTLRTDSRVNRLEITRNALRVVGRETEMRQEIAEALSGLIAGADPRRVTDLTEDETESLLRASNLVSLARTAVVRDFKGDVMDGHMPEMATRFAKQLAQIFRGGLAIGMDRPRALRLALRVARDSLNPLRLQIIEDVATHPGTKAYTVARRIDKPKTTVKREIEALHMLSVLTVAYQEESLRNEPDRKYDASLYRLSDQIDPAALALLSPQPAGGEDAPGAGRTPDEQSDAWRGRCPFPGEPLAWPDENEGKPGGVAKPAPDIAQRDDGTLFPESATERKKPPPKPLTRKQIEALARKVPRIWPDDLETVEIP